MLKKTKKSKPFGLFLLIFIFILFLIIIFKSYDYTKTYYINDFKITEVYSKKDKYYKFSLEKNNINYQYLISNKYIKKRELITEILTSNNDNEECIIPKSNYLDFYPLCSKDKEVYTYNLSTIKDFYNYKEININKDKYKDIEINYLNNKEYLLYNYKGFNLINLKKEITLFNKDIYNIELVYELDNYLIIPDYNNNYFFNKLYIINMLNGKKEEINFEFDISFSSIFLGDYKNNIYLLDKKEEQEYVINIKKKKIDKSDYLILNNNKLIKTTYRNIVNNNIFFEKNRLHNYKVINNYLYEVIDTNIKLTNNKVDKIIKIDNDTVYYLVKDKLFMYNNTYGEILLLTNYEWNFNNTNMIFISK